MEFSQLKRAIQAQFAKMTAKGNLLFATTTPRDALWENYLAAFPEGSNPIYRERTEHDCSCCRHFIKNIGGVVSLNSKGELTTIWDIEPLGNDYDAVVKSMARLVRQFEVDGLFKHSERAIGTDKNFEDTVNGVKTWEHFHVTLPTNVIVPKGTIGSAYNDSRGNFDVLLRTLTTIKIDTVDTVLELIEQNSIYRGAEFKGVLTELRKVMVNASKVFESGYLNNYVWYLSATLSQGLCRVRNTSIGTLLIDLAEGMELEDAVKRFEAVVAPTNYKRPKALVTKAMIEKAKAKIIELGLLPALERRFAHLKDISAANVLFADRDARKVMGDAFDTLSDEVKVDTKKLDRVEEVAYEKFITDILPKAKQIEALVENRHMPNFMSMIAPVDPSAPNLFKWNNGFSWSYAGDVTDSIKERVKKAGGNVTGELCCRLAWDCSDDLDFHMTEPDGHRIYFSNRGSKSRNGGCLDVDANGMDGLRPNPVENIFYQTISKMQDGDYRLFVHNYSRRSSNSNAFEVEIEHKGDLTLLAYEKIVGQGERVDVATITKKGNQITIKPQLPSTTASKEIWGINSHSFKRVTSIMYSPNHWDDQGVGNKHLFFMLDGCKNMEKTRGFYNEFLKEELNEHRKVLEMVGSKMLTEEDPEQLSGLGFSTTQRNDITLRVKGSFTRIIKVVF